MYSKLNDFLLGYKEVKQVNYLKCKEMGHFINDALDDEVGKVQVKMPVQFKDLY